MRKNRTYRAKSVKNIEWKEVVRGREHQAIHVGVDVGKRAVLAVVRWNGDEFERPWLVKNPDEICQFVGLLVELKRGRELTVAMEPTGTYGDVLRQALSDLKRRPDRRFCTRPLLSTSLPRYMVGPGMTQNQDTLTQLVT